MSMPWQEPQDLIADPERRERMEAYRDALGSAPIRLVDLSLIPVGRE